MDASKYLPPFTQGQRGDATQDPRGKQDAAGGAAVGGRHDDRQMVDAGSVTDPEATYADFLGDQVDD
ncbi:hypothetical protein DEJ16_07495 [Curtobacterium sp. MCJR17_055]|uniref:hypothetical protein n=1 Tax=unclassified Curtobacterium TaxID=257496 RepID=UPI000D9F02EF|nr:MULTISPECIES: hypothetical protein [unclassified Curtobacterium]PYY32431.1 hypothetical protein DEI87_14875 [Curtobacterium sp. MCBD17_029]PYY57165.1 hypothetical protein DEJ16_07495 [Curtobacterium sp. MCJR17_055]PYY61919.1 hypothetical protein DEJ26_00025 [Curtobacterium sp. MCPF17_015]WIB36284.1 hypothetical protein DEJ15_03660 [Curtobacterium sp. MCJR17_043]